MWQLREISGGSGFTCQNDLRANFGLGDATNVDIVRIEWPSGIVQETNKVAAKQFLTVTEPVVTITPRIQELVVGSDMSFTVSNNLSGPLIYQWRFNGTNIVGQTNATLVVSNAQVANLGKYSVALTNPASGDFVISAPALLRLPGFPQITVQPQSQIVEPGTQVTLQVTAIGAEPLYYQWRLFEVNGPGAT